MNCKTLIEPIVTGLPEDRRQIMEGGVSEFALGETQQLLLALVAAASKRERQLIRILLRDMEVKEEHDRLKSENK